MKRITVLDLHRMKRDKQKIVTMTADDFQMARIIDKAGVDIVLIGDSGGRYQLGHQDNNSVTMDEMVLMARSVARGVCARAKTRASKKANSAEEKWQSW